MGTLCVSYSLVLMPVVYDDQILLPRKGLALSKPSESETESGSGSLPGCSGPAKGVAGIEWRVPPARLQGR